ncbi:MAG: peptidylprolyl isomerase [Betaproteobacteria bacterium]|nr:peptidylprolyl isomerase [Betaproteobacteria bacterium]
MNTSRSLSFRSLAAAATLALAFATGTAYAGPTVEIDTSLGKIVAELDSEKAPITVKNFISYVESGFYNGTIFHRVIPGFMIQGGGFTPNMAQKETHAPIANEAKNGLSNKRGTLAMARTDNPDSATAQFFINLVDNAPLDYNSPHARGAGYAVFGKVVSGMDVVDKIAQVQTGNKGMHQNVPLTPVTIRAISVASAKTEAADAKKPDAK